MGFFKCLVRGLSYTKKEIMANKVTITLVGIVASICCGASVPVAFATGIMVLGTACCSAKIIEQFWGNFTPMFILLLLGGIIWPLTGVYVIIESSTGALVYVLSGLILRSHVGYGTTVEMWAGLIMVMSIPMIIVSVNIISITIAWLFANSIVWVGVPVAWVYTQWTKVNQRPCGC